MATFAQLHLPLVQSARAAKLGDALLVVLEHVLLTGGLGSPYREVNAALRKLSEAGIDIELDSLIGSALAQKRRDAAYYRKKQDKKKALYVEHDVEPVVDSNAESYTPRERVETKTSSPAEKEVARKLRKPRQPSKGKLALAEFNAAVTDATGSPSCVTGMANETRAAAFADAVSAAGETMRDAVARRHALGKNLTLHWMMNDYASDRTAKRPVNTANNLRQPHPRQIPTDPDEARKYWLGEEEPNEPRFDFG